MKNKRLAAGFSGTLLALLMLAGCESGQKSDKKVARKFAEWVTNKANTEALAQIDENYVYNKGDESWLAKARHDSITYRNALERDANIVLDYVGKYNNVNDIWKQIENAPVYAYGKGSFINDNDKWEYSDSVRTGCSKAHVYRINYNEYKRSLKNIYTIRNARAKAN